MLTGQIRKDIKKFKESKWQKLADAVNNGNKYARSYWKSINKILGKNKQKSNIKGIMHNDIYLDSEQDIANCFGQHFRNIIFSDVNDEHFDREWFDQVNNKISDINININSESNITLSDSEIIKAIKQLKTNKAKGHDGINNKMLKNLPPQFILIMKELFEKSINSGKLLIGLNPVTVWWSLLGLGIRVNTAYFHVSVKLFIKITRKNHKCQALNMWKIIISSCQNNVASGETDQL